MIINCVQINEPERKSLLRLLTELALVPVGKENWSSEGLAHREDANHHMSFTWLSLSLSLCVDWWGNVAWFFLTVENMNSLANGLIAWILSGDTKIELSQGRNSEIHREITRSDDYFEVIGARVWLREAWQRGLEDSQFLFITKL